MSYDRQTVNVLVLELATMVVAIAIAFGASFLTTFQIDDVLYFVFATLFVLWFWWGYVMDRLEFPPLSKSFPFWDVLVLLLIAIIPFALRQREISAFAGTLAAMLFAWGLLIRGIIRENLGSLSAEQRQKLRLESRGRFVVGLILSLCASIGYALPLDGLILLFVAGLVAVAWTGLVRRGHDGVTNPIRDRQAVAREAAQASQLSRLPGQVFKATPGNRKCR